MKLDIAVAEIFSGSVNPAAIEASIKAYEHGQRWLRVYYFEKPGLHQLRDESMPRDKRNVLYELLEAISPEAPPHIPPSAVEPPRLKKDEYDRCHKALMIVRDRVIMSRAIEAYVAVVRQQIAMRCQAAE